MAVSVSGPTDLGVSEQLPLPETRAAEQFTPVLSVTVTFPVGVPEAGVFADTVKLTVMLCARMIVLADDVTVVVVLPFETCWAMLPDVALKLASPAYVAAIVSGPTFVGTIEHWPAPATSVITQPAPV